MKKRLLGVLLLMTMLLCACGKEAQPESSNDNTNADVTSNITSNVTPEPTQIPEPTPVPDSEVLASLVHDLLDEGEEKVASMVSGKGHEDAAIESSIELSLPASLLGALAYVDVEADIKCYVSSDNRMKMLVDVDLGRDDLVSGELYLDEDLNLIVGVPDDVDGYLGIPVTITGLEDGLKLSVEDLDISTFKDVFKVLKKGVIKSLKFDRVEKDYTVGKLDKSLTGTAYFSDVNIIEFADALEEACEILQDAGLPVTAPDLEGIEEADLDKVQLVYITDGKYKSYELVNVEDDVSVGFVFCKEGISVYGYKEEEAYELFRYDKTGEDEGTFYLYLEDEELSGEYSKDKHGNIELFDILLGESGILIDSVRFGNGVFSIYCSTNIDDEAPMTLGVNLSKEEGSVEFNVGEGQETLRLNLEYESIEFEDFEVPEADTEDAEEFMMELLENNEALLGLFMGEDSPEESEYQ